MISPCTIRAGNRNYKKHCYDVRKAWWTFFLITSSPKTDGADSLVVPIIGDCVCKSNRCLYRCNIILAGRPSWYDCYIPNASIILNLKFWNCSTNWHLSCNNNLILWTVCNIWNLCIWKIWKLKTCITNEFSLFIDINTLLALIFEK